MIGRVSGWIGSASWRARSAMVVAGLLGCLASASTVSATPSGTHLSVFAGNGAAGLPTPGPATSSALHHPHEVAVDPATGDLYIADYGNADVEKVTPEGALSIVAGSGTGTKGPPTPGRATHSTLDSPTGLAVDSTGNLYIADPYNNVVEKVTPKGTLSIVAGTGTPGAPTPGRATRSPLDVPSDVAVDSTGDLYIAEPDYHEVEKVTAQGTLSIVAGTGTLGAPTPGPAAQSELAFPHGLGIDLANDDLYIADYGNSEVEQVTPQGTLSIVAGTGTSGAPTPGLATQSPLDDPLGVGVNPGTGDVFISDTYSNVIERVGPVCPVATGSLTGVHLGQVALGMTRAQARKALPVYTVSHKRFDTFCLSSGQGILAGYPSAKQLKSVSSRQRTRLHGRVVLALTANRHYVLDHITAGTRIAEARRHLAHAQRFEIGGNTWYVLPGSKSTKVVEVQHGTVEQVGIANSRLTATRAQQRRLLSGV